MEIAKLKRFASVVNNSANIHAIHSVFLLEQKKTAVATELTSSNGMTTSNGTKSGTPRMSC
jgi:hypothetical protein